MRLPRVPSAAATHATSAADAEVAPPRDGRGGCRFGRCSVSIEI